MARKRNGSIAMVVHTPSPAMQHEMDALVFNTRRLAALPLKEKGARHRRGENVPGSNKVSQTLNFVEKRHRRE